MKKNIKEKLNEFKELSNQIIDLIIRRGTENSDEFITSSLYEQAHLAKLSNSDRTIDFKLKILENRIEDCKALLELLLKKPKTR